MNLKQLQEVVTFIDKEDNFINSNNNEKINKNKDAVISNNSDETTQTTEYTLSNQVNDNLKIRIVRKNSLDADVNATLRDPIVAHQM